MKTNIFKNHRHSWIIASIAITLAVVFVIILPQSPKVSLLFTGIAASHILIALIAIFTGWLIAPQKFLEKIWKKKPVVGYDFGWSPKWLNVFIIASFFMLFMALNVYFSFEGKPFIQLISYSLLLLLSVNLFIANLILRNSKRQAKLTLPMVTLLPENGNSILDVGCGAGRTTIAIADAFPKSIITAFDKFDADYIADGGTNLIKRNIEIAGIVGRTNIVKGDFLTSPFADNHFDAIVSSYMFDHLGPNKIKALKESYRIMKPGGRFLLIIAIKSVSTFGIANVLSLLFPSRKTWIKWIEQTGFKMVCSGNINEGAYFCFEKPKNN
jgi:ubiquinone/menaquinone biosynthesis C-methylase UbiE